MACFQVAVTPSIVTLFVDERSIGAWFASVAGLLLGYAENRAGMDRRVVGTILGVFFILVAVIMAYDINSVQRSLPFEAERIRLQFWKIATLFGGGILATLTAIILMRPPST